MLTWLGLIPRFIILILSFTCKLIQIQLLIIWNLLDGWNYLRLFRNSCCSLFFKLWCLSQACIIDWWLWWGIRSQFPALHYFIISLFGKSLIVNMEKHFYCFDSILLYCLFTIQYFKSCNILSLLFKSFLMLLKI